MSAREFSFHGSDGGGVHGIVPQRAYVTGMAIALCGVLLFFAALLSAWVVRAGLATTSELPLDLPGRLLGANTCVLLLSSAMLEKARRRFRAGNERGFRVSWYSATALGLLFLVGQVIAWRVLASGGTILPSSPDASFFYLLTAAHAVHLAGGLAGLAAVAWRPLRRMTLATAVNVAAMYWHFLTVLWASIFLLLMVYGR